MTSSTQFDGSPHVRAPVAWWSEKQKGLVATSAAEAEFISMEKAVKNTRAIINLVDEIFLKEHTATIYCDNMPCIMVLQNHTNPKLVRHMDIKYHFVRTEIEKGKIMLKYLSTKDMPADMLTKALAREQFEKFTGMMVCE